MVAFGVAADLAAFGAAVAGAAVFAAGAGVVYVWALAAPVSTNDATARAAQNEDSVFMAHTPLIRGVEPCAGCLNRR